jgi:hypothetical protein
MRDGIYSFIVRSGDRVMKGDCAGPKQYGQGILIGTVFIIVSRKPENTDCRVHAIRYGSHMQGVSLRGFPATLKGEEKEHGFRFEGEPNGGIKGRVAIQGTWLHDLPVDSAGDCPCTLVTDPERCSQLLAGKGAACW